jgi:4-amino-4-deoxy-L-arabinose transferase-like glycosyltransferase
MSGLPVRRRLLPILLLATGVAGIAVASGRGSSSPANRAVEVVCVLLIVTSWAVSLWERRRPSGG